jgi:predicted amidophosphoribosyltransferase
MVRVLFILMTAAMGGRVFRFTELIGDQPDLPCPWCRAPTSENDTSCPRCGKRFG